MKHFHVGAALSTTLRVQMSDTLQQIEESDAYENEIQDRISLMQVQPLAWQRTGGGCTCLEAAMEVERWTMCSSWR